MRILKSLASIRLTVGLLTALMFLIFVGTLAQVQLGIWQTVETYFRSLLVWIDLQLFLPGVQQPTGLALPFPGGLTLGILLLVNLIAAHIARFKWEWRRTGILVMHAGLIVLLLGEFVTARYATEGIMSIDVGGSSNYVEDLRAMELAIIEPMADGSQRELQLSGAMLEAAARSRQPIAHPDLPFVIHVDEWFANSQLLRAPHAPSPATAGIGLEAVARAIPRVRGVDGGQSDISSAYVTLERNGQRLGTWLVSAHLIEAQRVDADGIAYGLALRHRRTYKPYTLHLLEFRHDKFTGTEIARNFSSRVRLVDPARGMDREVVIWMNNPLRHAGATFYQASYKPDGSGTVLQVVRNPGAILPYVACVLVGGGMLLHFMVSLLRWLRREARPPAAAGEPAPQRDAQPVAVAVAVATTRPAWWVPAGATLLALLIAGSALLRPAPSRAFDLSTFSTIPVSAGGRIKPLDTQARHVLQVAGGRQRVYANDGRHSAIEFMLRLMADPQSVSQWPLVRVDHPDVLAILGLAPEARGRLELGIIQPHWEKILAQARPIFNVPSRQRDAYQRAVLSLYRQITEILAHSSMVEPYAIPPLVPDGEWQSFQTAFIADMPEELPEASPPPAPTHPAVNAWIEMMAAASVDDAPAFNTAVRAYDQLLRESMPGVMRMADFEVWFNRLAPFYGTLQVYVLAFLLICGAMLLGGAGNEPGAALLTRRAQWAASLRAAAIAMLYVAVSVHTFAIVGRVVIQGRPPVTNLYSSAVFVGWAAVLLGLFIERYHPTGLAALGASVVGFATLVVAHNLGSDGDTMQMMQAVLDSNFWLATHVVTITLGYSANFLAGALGLLYVILGVFTRRLTPELARQLARMVYGVVCFAMLLSFVGTVLGGIWADQSWGRFWGWDPKENGAALVVLINAIILHARWGGLIRQRGLMILAISGNIVTAWSWFGTNMLGIGLHSYGFMDSALMWLMLFNLSQLLVMGLAMLPPAAWRSMQAEPASA